MREFCRLPMKQKDRHLKHEKMYLTVAFGAILDIAGAELGALSLAVFPTIAWDRLVTLPRGILHSSSTGAGTFSPSTPGPPATMSGNLQTGQRERENKKR